MDAAPERRVYSISDLNHAARLLLESGLASIWVEGEISNFARPSSGHWYFSLKDQNAQVRCAMFRQRNMLVGFAPREGMQVLARARVTLYEPRGDYQLQIERLEEAGLGVLQRAFDELKRRLAAEGLFAAERKKPLPGVPGRIGVITSPIGAALRDILHILARRFPAAEVIVYPVPVQGAAAPPAIVRALQSANQRAECDVLIVARGGGSLEDLWAFNEETVARAIAASELPVVSGVGHETDFTIADFVADVRAPTPSGAAQLVSPDQREWRQRLVALAQRLLAGVQRQLQGGGQRWQHLNHRLGRLHPEARLTERAQRLDGLEIRLLQALRTRLAAQENRLQRATHALALHSPRQRVARRQLQVQALTLRLEQAMSQRLQQTRARFDIAARALQAVSPLATLGRGFAVITRRDGTLVQRADQLQVGEEFDARLASGGLRARVIATES
ncbi:MAG: exodeoxyribonuclease VII large subunit [Steroidobacteraceae bacterium]